MVWRKIKELLMCFIPVAIYLLSQVIAMVGCTIVNMIYLYKKYGFVSISTFRGSNMNEWIINYNNIILITEIVTLVASAVAYYGIMKARDLKRFSKNFTGRSIPAILLMMIGSQAILSLAMSAAYIVVPEVVDDYSDLMSNLDYTSMGVLFTVVILGPIAEEILFRGMTFKFARRLSRSFWVANVIQALLFGLLHWNVVQSTYAFLMGLILGVIYRKYNSLTASIVAHFGFNFIGAVVVGVIEESGLTPILAMFSVALVGIVCVYFAIRLFQNDSAIDLYQKEYDEMAIVERVRYREKIEAKKSNGAVPEMSFSTDSFEKGVDNE